MAKFFAEEEFLVAFGSLSSGFATFVAVLLVVFLVSIFLGADALATFFFTGAFFATVFFTGALVAVFALTVIEPDAFFVLATAFFSLFRVDFLTDVPTLVFQPKRFSFPTTAFFDKPKHRPISDVDNPLPKRDFNFFNVKLSQPLLLIKSLLSFIMI